MDPWVQSQKYGIVFINKAMILINQALIKVLGVSYEPLRLDDSSTIYF
jgi:hypothetical protein